MGLENLLDRLFIPAKTPNLEHGPLHPQPLSAEPPRHPAECHGIQAALAGLQFTAEVKPSIAQRLRTGQTLTNPLGGMQRDVGVEFGG
jgi:hypothetical protein